MSLPDHVEKVRNLNVIVLESLTTFAPAAVFKEMWKFNFQREVHYDVFTIIVGFP